MDKSKLKGYIEAAKFISNENYKNNGDVTLAEAINGFSPAYSEGGTMAEK